MPLFMLVPLVVVGLAVIIGAVHFAGGSVKPAPLGKEFARQRFATDHHGFDIEECVISDDGAVALLFSSEDGDVGLVVQLGNKALTRRVNAELIQDVQENEKGIEVQLNDFTLPTVKILMTGSTDRKPVVDRLLKMEGMRA